MIRKIGGVLASIESLLGGLIEGPIERLFKTKIQPVHLARRLESAMRDGALISVDGLMAPNHYVIALDSKTYSRFEGARSNIQRDLERSLVLTAARLRCKNVEPFKVELIEEKSLSEGTFKVEATFLKVAVESIETPKEVGEPSVQLPKGPEHTQVMPTLSSDVLTAAAAVIEMVGPTGPLRRVPLHGDQWTIGRSSDNNIVIPETAVSRYHATIKKNGGQFIVEDMNSTNGMFLNGKQVRAAKLKDGDHILIGTVEMIFKENH